MKVALYYPWVYLHSGIERTIANIIALSRHDWAIFTNRYEPDATFPELRKAKIIELPEISVNRSFGSVAQSAWRLARQRLPVDGYDALFVFCEGLGDLILLRRYPIPVACLCFTPLRAAFDPHYQNNYLAGLGSGRLWREPILRTGAWGFGAVDRWLWKRYDRVFAISQEVKRRIVASRLFPASRVELLNPGIDFPRFNPTGVYSKNFLVHGRIMWTKNLQLVIDAFLLLLKRRSDLNEFTLTIAGYVDRKSEKYYASLRERAAGCPNIRFVIGPPDDHLFAICQEAYAILYPPFNEDWGLVPLEGMALEKPVIAVNRGGPCETVLDGRTGYLVDPEPARFADAMERLANDPELVRRLGKAARVRASEYDWPFFCQKLDQAVDELADTASQAATFELVRRGQWS